MRKLEAHITLAELIELRDRLRPYHSAHKAILEAIDGFLAMPCVMGVELDEENDLAVIRKEEAI